MYPSKYLFKKHSYFTKIVKQCEGNFIKYPYYYLIILPLGKVKSIPFSSQVKGKQCVLVQNVFLYRQSIHLLC